jgi:hypothetical protein
MTELTKERIEEEEKLIDFLNKLTRTNKPIYSDHQQVKYFSNKIGIVIARIMRSSDKNNQKFSYLTIQVKEGETTNSVSINVNEDRVKEITDILNKNDNRNIINVLNDITRAIA